MNVFQNIKPRYKNILSLCTNNKLSEKIIKNIILFTIASKTMKHLRIILTKEIKDFYTANYKTMIKETGEDTNK